MDKIARIRAEIERLKKYAKSSKLEWIDNGYDQNAFAEDCRIASFDKLLSFLDTLSEEPDKSLEDASYDAVCRIFGCDPMYFGNKAEITARECDYLFRAGAEWQKEQMTKEDAI